MENPFSKITENDMIIYAGKVIAISFETGEILESGENSDILRLKMRKYPKLKYASICLPYLQEE